MTKNTKLKELIFWLIFVAVGAYLALWLVDLGFETYSETDNLIFTKNILE